MICSTGRHCADMAACLLCVKTAASNQKTRKRQEKKTRRQIRLLQASTSQKFDLRLRQRLTCGPEMSWQYIGDSTVPSAPPCWDPESRWQTPPLLQLAAALGAAVQPRHLSGTAANPDKTAAASCLSHPPPEGNMTHDQCRARAPRFFAIKPLVLPILYPCDATIADCFLTI